MATPDTGGAIPKGLVVQLVLNVRKWQSGLRRAAASAAAFTAKVQAQGVALDKRLKHIPSTVARAVKNAATGAMKIVGKLAAAVIRAAPAVTAIGTAAVGAVGAMMSRQASDFEENLSKFRVVFGEFSAQSEAFIADFGSKVGRSRLELTQMMSSIQDTFVPLGFARGEAAKMSQAMTKLAVDVASFNKAADAEVMRDFQSAIVGNHETVRKYGIIITQAALSQELLTMGIQGGVQAATEQQKVQARLNLIMAGTSDAQGDAIRTAGSFANQMKAMKATVANAATEFGSNLNKHIQQTIERFGGVESVTALVRAGFAAVTEAAKFLVTKLGELVKATAEWVRAQGGAEVIAIRVRQSLTGLSIGFQSLKLAVQSAITGFVAFGRVLVEGVGKAAMGVLVGPIRALTRGMEGIIRLAALAPRLFGFGEVAEDMDQVADAIRRIEDASVAATPSWEAVKKSFSDTAYLTGMTDTEAEIIRLGNHMNDLGRLAEQAMRKQAKATTEAAAASLSPYAEAVEVATDKIEEMQNTIDGTNALIPSIPVAANFAGTEMAESFATGMDSLVLPRAMTAGQMFGEAAGVGIEAAASRAAVHFAPSLEPGPLGIPVAAPITATGNVLRAPRPPSRLLPGGGNYNPQLQATFNITTQGPLSQRDVEQQVVPALQRFTRMGGSI